MLVSPDSTWGTVGGGTLEWRAVETARDLLRAGGKQTEFVVSLGPDTGQCCGGRVGVRITCLDAGELAEIRERVRNRVAARPVLLLFGAGHVGRALAASLSLLPLRLIWVDSRPHEFGAVPPGVEIVSDGSWERVVASAPPGAGALVLTHNHALDGLIVTELLQRGDFTYVGMIGSLTKRRRFESAMRAMGMEEERIASLVCPVGDRGVRDKRPAMIAAFVTAEIAERLLAHAGEVL